MPADAPRSEFRLQAVGEANRVGPPEGGTPNAPWLVRLVAESDVPFQKIFSF
jgi:hypothetical protein